MITSKAAVIPSLGMEAQRRRRAPDSSYAAPMRLAYALFALGVLASCGGGTSIKPISGNCDLTHPDVCRDLAQRQDSGVDGKPNPTRAAELYRDAAAGYLQACDSGDDGLACAQLAELYRHGRGVVANSEEATRLE